MSEENREYSQNDRMASTHNEVHHHRRHGWRIFWLVVGILILIAIFFAGVAMGYH